MTPAKGATATIGAKPTREAIDKYMALCVSSVIHQMITKCAIDDPNNETFCPNHNDRYLLNVVWSACVLVADPLLIPGLLDLNQYRHLCRMSSRSV
jgi:hypothetical protein